MTNDELPREQERVRMRIFQFRNFNIKQNVPHPVIFSTIAVIFSCLDRGSRHLSNCSSVRRSQDVKNTPIILTSCSTALPAKWIGSGDTHSDWLASAVVFWFFFCWMWLFLLFWFTSHHRSVLTFVTFHTFTSHHFFYKNYRRNIWSPFGPK